MNVLCLLLAMLGADLRTELNTLIEAERNFGRTSIARGTKEAFLANLADNSIIFRPTAVAGKKWTAENPGPSSQLSWEPEFADIAPTADLGYTTGPFEVRRTAQESPVSFGHYVTVWRKQSDGMWKVAIDIGIGHPSVPKPSVVDSPAIPKQVAKVRAQRDIENSRAALMQAERAFSYASSLAPGRRLYRQGMLPSSTLTPSVGKYDWAPAAAEISNSAELGYTYGTVDFKVADKPAIRNNYLRIWKKQRNGQWKVVLDLVS